MGDFYEVLGKSAELLADELSLTLTSRDIYFNIKGGNHIEEITLEDTKAALKEANRVQTQRDPARQKKKQGFALFFCYENCHGKGFE